MKVAASGRCTTALLSGAMCVLMVRHGPWGIHRGVSAAIADVIALFSTCRTENSIWIIKAEHAAKRKINDQLGAVND